MIRFTAIYYSLLVKDVMFPFSSPRILRKKPPLKKPFSEPSQLKKSFSEPSQPKKPQYKFKIPPHFKKNTIVTYSQSEIKKQLKRYPGLLKTLGHAYQYQIVVTNSQQEKQYWFCRSIEVTMPLLKYLNEKDWTVDWQEKPFHLK